MGDWRDTTLGEVIHLQRGFDLTEKHSRPGPFPVISSAGFGYTTAEPKVQGPGVVTGRKGVLGKVHFSSGPYWPHDTTLWVKDFKGSDPRYVYYLLQTLPLASLDAGASNPTLNRNHAHLLPVRVPNAEAQQRISAVLGQLDDLIQNNRRRIELLEQMAQVIYREWFVRFRFPSHKDTRFVDSPLGPIPDGWIAVRLADLVSTQYGYTASADETPVGPRYLRGMDINKTSFIDWSTVPYCPINQKDRMKFQIALGDVFVIRMADPGKVGICEVDLDAVFASYLVRLRPVDRRVTPYFLFFTLCDDVYQSWVTGASTGATRKSVSAKVMTESLIVLPAPDVQSQFDSAIQPLRSLLNSLLAGNARLAAVRDLLLPKLVTGQIDVSESDLDAVVESVA